MSFGSDREGLDGFCDPLGDLRSVVERLADLDPVNMPGAALKTDLLRWSRRRDQEDAVFAAWVLAAMRAGIGVEDGYVDTIGWLAWKTGKSRAEIRKMVRWAELCELLPETGAAWREGRITTAAVALIADARVAHCDDELAAMETELLDRARRGDHTSLKVLTQHFKAYALADGNKPIPPDGLTMAEVGDRGALHGDFAKPALETIRAAVDKFTVAPTADNQTTLAQRRAEGFVRLCEVALARGVDAEGARPVVSYLTHARTDTDVTHPLTLGTFTGVIDPRERDRILCDATIVKITSDNDGNPLSVGRASRVWPAAIRRAITARDRHCRWPGCEIPAPWCDIHHAIPWETGGTTSTDNGHLLCRRHHTFRHQHPDWNFTFDQQHFRVFRADGTEVHPDPWTDGDWAV